jgi:pimeloyl-ACP methyl ester carboxylesterase
MIEYIPVLVAVGSAALAYLIQPAFLYFPRKYAVREKSLIKDQLERNRLNFEVLEYQLSSSQGQNSYLVTPRTIHESQVTRLLVFFGGNAMTAFDGLMWFMEIQPHMKPNHQYAFLAVDYPGYGFNEGSPSPESIQESVKLAFTRAVDHLRQKRNIQTLELIVVGHSLGASVATGWLASVTPDPNLSIMQLILSAPFTSVAEMATHMFGVPRLLSPLLSRHNWDNSRDLKKVIESGIVTGKIRIIHGTKDELVPFEMGVSLSKIDPSRTQLIPAKDYMHNNLLGSYKVYAYAISE